MIQVSNLSKSYGGQVLFENISFNVSPREIVGLVGRNGEGKTTLFSIILGQEEPDTGTVSIPNGYRIGHLSQHLRFTRSTVLAEAALGLAHQSAVPNSTDQPATHTDDLWQVEAILSGLGFSQDDLNSPPNILSGGFQVRLSLAKLLVSDPDMLLLDEPTNYLDIVSIRWLTRYMRAWKREAMLITHDRNFMDGVITHTLGLHRGKARKLPGDTAKYYQQISREEEIYEKTRLNDEKKRKEVELFISRFRAKAQLGSLVQSRVKTLQKREKAERLQKIDTIEFAFRYAQFPAKVLMESEGLSFAYDGGHRLVDRLNLTVSKDDRIAIVGPNGRGKTTLLRLLADELTPTAGEIRRHSRLRIGYYGQTNVEQLMPERTVIDEIQSVNPETTGQEVRDICGALLFSEDLALKRIEVLSGGEKSRVSLGKILVTPCNLLLLDEPTNHLDMESCDSLLAAIDAFPGAAIIVTHNEMFLHTLANRLIVFDRDRVRLYEGSYQTFLDEVGWEADGNPSAEAMRAARRPAGNSSLATAPSIDQKALRHAQAELIRQRSRVLKPLATRMQQIEAEIVALEDELSSNHRETVQASEAGDGAAIVALATRAHEIEARTEALYAELDEITRAHDAAAQRFEAQAAALVGGIGL
jgi:ATP-binding cassette subfamily F protein 3